eukprot:746780-Hanusia_phi.AAC.1
MAIFCGMIAGCGGGILANWLGMIGKVRKKLAARERGSEGGVALRGWQSSDWMFGTPPVLKGPSITVRTAFFASCIYYLLRNPHEFLPYGKDALLTVETSLSSSSSLSLLFAPLAPPLLPLCSPPSSRCLPAALARLTSPSTTRRGPASGSCGCSSSPCTSSS